MQNKKVQKLLIFELVIMIVQLILSIFFDNIYLRTMGEGTRTIIVRSNFLSYMTWGYGNYFPLLFIIFTIITMLLLIISYVRNNFDEDKLSSNLIILGGLVFLLIPLFIRMMVISKGTALIITLQVILLVLNIIRTNI